MQFLAGRRKTAAQAACRARVAGGSAPEFFPNAHSRNGMYPNNYQVLSEDGERVSCRARGPGNGGTRESALVVLPTPERPSRLSLDRLTYEFGLKDELDEAWAVRPLELVRDGGRVMLVLEVPGGEPLDLLLSAPMEVGQFLRLAIGIAVALGWLHQRGLVHKDIKPTSILVNSAVGEVRLTRFGIASRLSRERQVRLRSGRLEKRA
jgi:serine/threonine protein kinase